MGPETLNCYWRFQGAHETCVSAVLAASCPPMSQAVAAGMQRGPRRTWRCGELCKQDTLFLVLRSQFEMEAAGKVVMLPRITPDHQMA